jgi:general secretion pathway protein F
MPAFRYEAVDAGGATRKGVLNADSAARRARRPAPAGPDAAHGRSHRGPGRRSGAARSRGFGERLSQVELALFTRQLASLLEAGLPLEQAFTALLEQAERAPMCAT